MPYCPSCESEYREGITHCRTCQGVALVAELPEVDQLRDGEETAPVGLTRGVERRIEVDGQTFDLMRCHTFPAAIEHRTILHEGGFAAKLVEVDASLFADRHARYEVHVRKSDFAEAEAHLHARWEEDHGVEGAGSEEDAEACPACGAQVPLDVEECPECGLHVGMGVEAGREDEQENEEA